MSTNLEYRKRIKDREKEKVGREASKLNAGEKELERGGKKQRTHFICWRNNVKFCSGGEKMRNASRNKGEKSDSEKKNRTLTTFNSSIKRVTRKFLEISRCSRANNGKEINKKSVLHV